MICTCPPALSPEEWKNALRDRAGMAAAIQKAWGDGSTRENDHQLAALALICQSFGFTAEDITELLDLAKSWDEAMPRLMLKSRGRFVLLKSRPPESPT